MILILCLVGAAVEYRLRLFGRFGDWFCAERGAGPGKNGWV